jgi:hypothetical protein
VENIAPQREDHPRHRSTGDIVKVNYGSLVCLRGLFDRLPNVVRVTPGS